MANSSNQDPFNLPPSGGAVDAPKIPHSNEPVRREFDKTDLGDVYPLDDSEALEAAVPDFAAQTPTEQRLGLNAPEVTIPSREPAIAPAAKEAPRRRGLVGGIMAGAAILGGAAFVATRGGGGEAETSERPAATAAPSPTAQPETDPGAPVVIPATEAPAQAPTTTAAAETPAGPVGEDDGTEVDGQTPEAENPEYRPVFMTAESPEELAEQFIHNLDCMTNAPQRQLQERCLGYLLGAVDGVPGPLTTGWQDAIEQTNTYRQIYPDYRQDITYELVDSNYTDENAQLVMHITYTSTGGDPDYEGAKAESTSRFNFIREEAFTDGEMQPVWTVNHKDTLTPEQVADLG